ncbi:hypothetical protein B0H15DRAFT_803823 [Mycena belliarum]|uniref:Uncharacterized protein n=1 Tax=Mycena belliarum TaxID=1033014 RepID=A0AAD6XM65_9AGAR|nr:hypothetical protein B0H15DRAFT_803823 [Mycena belliae]
MEVLNTDLSGAVPRVYTRPVDRSNPSSVEWVGLNKSVDYIPEHALELREEGNYQGDHTPTDQWGQFTTIEWADEPDWYGTEVHFRGWIPLAKEGDTKRGAWARNTKVNMGAVLGEDGRYHLVEDATHLVQRDLIWFRELLENVCESALYELHTHSPPLFDIERVDAAYATENDVHKMVMDTRRSILEIEGHLSWWTAAVEGWLEGLPYDVVERVWSLDLRSYKPRGYLIAVSQDWKELNFPLLVRHSVPLFYVWGLFEERDSRFQCLDPRVLNSYLQAVDSKGVRGLWGDEIPLVRNELEITARYDRFLQLKIDPYSRPRKPYWARRPVSDDEDGGLLERLYHHVVVESRAEEVTRVIFQRFHPRPRNEVLNQDDTVMDEDLPEPDLSAIRERYKGRCAPRIGQTFDSETGVESTRPVGEEKTVDEITRFEAHRLLVPPPNSLGNSSLLTRGQVDATTVGGSLGSRITSPDSDHSSERRWVEAMAKDEVRDTVDNYTADRRTRRPKFQVRRMPRRSPSVDDVRSHYSISTRTSRDGGSRRSASPEPRGRRLYPLRLSSPSPFRPCMGSQTVEEVQHRRARWLNNFADWGRYQALTDASIRFPRHILELAMERSIPFAIGFKRSDTDRFRPAQLRSGRQVSKAVVDRHNKGLRLNPAPSIATVYDQFCANDYMRGPSVQVSVHQSGANDSGDNDCIDVTWDEMAAAEYESLFGFVAGANPAEDTYLFPTDEMLEEYSDHYFREWNPFCDLTFRRIRAELDDKRGRRRTRRDWKDYFQSSNRGKYAPAKVANREFIEEGMERVKRVFDTKPWNKRRIRDLAEDLPAVFKIDF